ncbi:hypothetical protein BD311DRAFT_748705 [Dichomitus squalens]|uniref:Uncharacterized protein n=1 Tax=Dichomitus squalens TaxID=114155 RepID=A0A4Q9MZD7_9APHY|nr:hypothetical protein BD311DRAFT_748705 [Dichomitus squalens]
MCEGGSPRACITWKCTFHHPGSTTNGQEAPHYAGIAESCEFEAGALVRIRQVGSEGRGGAFLQSGCRPEFIAVGGSAGGSVLFLSFLVVSGIGPWALGPCKQPYYPLPARCEAQSATEAIERLYPLSLAEPCL